MMDADVENAAIIRTFREAADLMDLRTTAGRDAAKWFIACAEARAKNGKPLFVEDIWLPLAEEAVDRLGK